jgi:AcrR family transcriptional regulator
MLDAAMRLMQDGLVPSISDVAAAAQVSRATAYRYFPTQSALIQAAVDEALGPILEWKSSSTDVEQRVQELISFSYPRLDQYEAPLRAALRLALDQWALLHAGILGEEMILPRGRRIGLLNAALAPLRKKLGKARGDRLAQGLSLVFGTEAFVVLKDIWGLGGKEAEQVALWTARALIRSAMQDDAAPPRRAPRSSGARKNGSTVKTRARPVGSAASERTATRKRKQVRG